MKVNHTVSQTESLFINGLLHSASKSKKFSSKEQQMALELFERFTSESKGIKMDTTFYNVMITVSASSSEEAYSKLCKLFEEAGIEYTTDIYTSDEDKNEVEHGTEELWPSSE